MAPIWTAQNGSDGRQAPRGGRYFKYRPPLGVRPAATQRRVQAVHGFQPPFPPRKNPRASPYCIRLAPVAWSPRGEGDRQVCWARGGSQAWRAARTKRRRDVGGRLLRVTQSRAPPATASDDGLQEQTLHEENCGRKRLMLWPLTRVGNRRWRLAAVQCIHGCQIAGVEFSGQSDQDFFRLQS